MAENNFCCSASQTVLDYGLLNEQLQDEELVDIYDDIDYLIKDIEQNPQKVVEYLKYQKRNIAEYLLYKDICPCCGGKIVHKSDGCNWSEYWGQPCKEECYIAVCEDCGRTKEEMERM